MEEEKLSREEVKSLKKLARATQLAYNSWGRLFGRGILWGVATGLGATIGLAIILAILAYFFDATGLFESMKNSSNGFSEAIETFNRYNGN